LGVALGVAEHVSRPIFPCGQFKGRLIKDDMLIASMCYSQCYLTLPSIGVDGVNNDPVMESGFPSLCARAITLYVPK
jgi:hypothetical protein